MIILSKRFVAAIVCGTTTRDGKRTKKFAGGGTADGSRARGYCYCKIRGTCTRLLQKPNGVYPDLGHTQNWFTRILLPRERNGFPSAYPNVTAANSSKNAFTRYVNPGRDRNARPSETLYPATTTFIPVGLAAFSCEIRCYAFGPDTWSSRDKLQSPMTVTV